MFEKEAEDKAFEKYPIPERCDKIDFERNIKYEEGFKDGAEFGYKKGQSDQLVHKQYQLNQLRKANEWHYVSKEGHPNKDDIYLIIRNNGLHLGDYCCGGDGDIDCQSWCDYPSEEEIQDDSVIAWKEIVLPELPKEIK